MPLHSACASSGVASNRARPGAAAIWMIGIDVSGA
jgi:hypothetical protein